MKNWTYLSYYINAQIKISTTTWIAGTNRIWPSADTVGPNFGLSLNLYIVFVYESSDDSGKSTHLHMLDWAFTVRSTNIKYACLIQLDML